MSLPTILICCAAALSMAAMPLAAQTLQHLGIEPAAAAPGQPLTLTVQAGELGNAPNCGYVVQFGDGQKTLGGISQPEHAARRFAHTYAAPGRYTVSVEPVALAGGRRPACGGGPLQAEISVGGSAATTAAAGCPAGWQQEGRISKHGAFQCLAPKGTEPPAGGLACPPRTRYFHNANVGRIGCEPQG